MKIIVVDSAGDFVTEEYLSMLPKGIKVRGYETVNDYNYHPHGYQCGYYATQLLHLVPGEHELVFVRIFDGSARPIDGSNEFILDVLEHECKPDKDGKHPIINMSWGADDGDNPWMENRLGGYWDRWATKFLKTIGKSAVFSASGNSDVNDSDNDISYPWRMIPTNICIVGSHTRSGIPSVFSGDGDGVFMTMWGERLPLLDQFGKWSIGSGTSFASPKAAGLCAYKGMDIMDFRDFVRSHATKPDKYSGYLPHPKWGWGSMEYRYQEISEELPDALRPPVINRRMKNLQEYRDYDLIK